MNVRSGLCRRLISTKWMLLGITVLEKFSNLAGAKALSLCFFIAILSASLLVEERNMIFYNKILRSSNTVLRILIALHRNEAQKLSSAYNIFPGQSRNIDIKKAVIKNDTATEETVKCVYS